MVAILADDAVSRIAKFCILIKNSLKFVPNVPINNNQRWFR